MVGGEHARFFSIIVGGHPQIVFTLWLARSRDEKNRPVLPGGFSFRNPDFLFAVAEAPRPPSGACGAGCRRSQRRRARPARAEAGGSGWLWADRLPAASAGWASTRKLTFSRTVERRRAAARSAS